MTPFRTSRRVEFSQTDAAGIVHFASFFSMMESAEHEMLRSLGLSVMPPAGSGPRITWPRISTGCDYHAAARFEDELQIAVSVEHVGNSSVRYRFEITREADKVREAGKIATGTLTAVCCDLQSGRLEKVRIPDLIREALAKHQ